LGTIVSIRRVLALAAGVAFASFVGIAPVALAHPTAKVPAVCVHHALPKHLNVQVGYCP
jgi:hypothetical protein